MTACLVDANVLIDIMTQDARWFEWSAQALQRAADRYRLVINPIIYAEVSIRFFADRGTRSRTSESHVRS